MNPAHHTRSIFLLFLFALIFSCEDSKTEKAGSHPDSGALSIDTFSVIPDEIDGCACYFSNNAAEFSNGAFIYINDFSETAFMKINGELTRFHQTSFYKPDSSSTIAKASSGEFQMIMELRDSVPAGVESSIKSGKIRVTDQEGKFVEKFFVGECGC